MRTLQKTSASRIFHKILREEEKIETFVQFLKKEKIEPSILYAYQAFCCAILARNKSSFLEKGKYIKQYGQFIHKSLSIDPNCIEGRIVRLLIEKRLENVEFVDHTEEDAKFLKENLSSVQDPKLVEIIGNIL